VKRPFAFACTIVVVLVVVLFVVPEAIHLASKKQDSSQRYTPIAPNMPPVKNARSLDVVGFVQMLDAAISEGRISTVLAELRSSAGAAGASSQTQADQYVREAMQTSAKAGRRFNDPVGLIGVHGLALRFAIEDRNEGASDVLRSKLATLYFVHRGKGGAPLASFP